MAADLLIAGLLLGATMTALIFLAVELWEEHERPAVAPQQHIGLSVRSVPGAVIVLLSVKTDHLVCEPEAAMKVGVGLKRAAAEAMELRHP